MPHRVQRRRAGASQATCCCETPLQSRFFGCFASFFMANSLKSEVLGLWADDTAGRRHFRIIQNATALVLSRVNQALTNCRETAVECSMFYSLRGVIYACNAPRTDPA